MKKLFGILAIAAALFVASSVTHPNVARADGVAIGAFCQQYAGTGVIPAGQGECARFVATVGPALCKADAGGGVPAWQDFEFANQGQCVSFFQRLIRDALRNF